MGRAGRDGLPSACHLLLNREDAIVQHSLSHSTELSRIQIAALLLQVFQLRDSKESATKTADGMGQYLAQAPFAINVSLLLDHIESTVDISSAAVETILSILELPPFNLVVIEGTHFDSVKGRFRRSTEVLEKEDILIAAMVACNTYKPPKSESTVDFDFSEAGGSGDRSGMNSSYGLGFDSSASAANRGVFGGDQAQDSGWQRDRRAGGSYGGKIQEFECSRLAVAARCGLTPDEVSNGLYKLQKAGVLEYRLQDSALYVRTTPPAHSYDAYHFEAYSRQHTQQGTAVQQQYLQWVWYVADAVHTSLQCIATGGSQRIIDMWRATTTISQYTVSTVVTPRKETKTAHTSAKEQPASEHKATQHNPAEVHGAAQSLLSHVMSDADGCNTTTTDINADCDESVDLSTRLVSEYQQATGPFEVSLQAPADGTRSEDVKAASKLRERVRDCVNMLQRDPSLLTAVNTILKCAVRVLSAASSGHATTSIVAGTDNVGTVAVSAVTARRELQALCMCRIMHALPTRLLAAAAWRDRSEAWGCLKHMAFGELYVFVLEQLSRC
jgi:hypothetical protein